MQQNIDGLDAWIAFLRDVDIPVLARTARDLADLRADPKRLDARHVSRVVTQDPLMSVKLLRHFHRQRRARGFSDIALVERAVMMMGMEAFYAQMPAQPPAEAALRRYPDALIGLLRAVRRAHRAAHYAGDWAVMLHDLHFDEVRAAASLHQFADLLLWCYAPSRMLEMCRRQREDPTLRSHDAQEAVFGFPFDQLQAALAKEWGLPQLLLSLLDNACSLDPRVRNVALAVNLARHSAAGWNNAALPDDYREIGYLLRISPAHVMSLVGAQPAPAASAMPGDPGVDPAALSAAGAG